MKKRFLLALFIGFTKLLLAQDYSYTPKQAVIDSFKTRYAKADIKKWALNNDTCTVKFSLNNRKYIAYYSSNGSWIKTEGRFIMTRNLIPKVKERWKNSEFKNWCINEIVEVNTPQSHFYVFEVDNSPSLDSDHYYNFLERYHLYFATNGDLYKKERLP